MNLLPCTRYTNNTPWQQFWHVVSELVEVAVALVKGDIDHVAEELVDLQTSAETMLLILGYNDRKRAAVRRLVRDKNAARKYHTL